MERLINHCGLTAFNGKKQESFANMKPDPKVTKFFEDHGWICTLFQRMGMHSKAPGQ